MKTLILVRHGKSDWSLSQPDILRGLTAGGKNDVRIVAAASAKRLPETLKVFCSGAARAIATAKIFCETVGIPLSDIEYRDDLYTFSLRELESIVLSADDSHSAMLLFGHNEAFTDFVNKYGSLPIENLPTSGFAKITFDEVNWNKIKQGQTEALLFPKQLRNGH